MSTNRRRARALAFQTLFELENRPDRTLEEALQDRLGDLEEETRQPLDPKLVDFARGLVQHTMQHREEVDQRIARAAPAIPIEQLPLVDRAVLELAIYELLYARNTPVQVIINEAVELAKTFGGENSSRFVNGVLGTIAEEPEVQKLRAERQATHHRKSRTQAGG